MKTKLHLKLSTENSYDKNFCKKNNILCLALNNVFLTKKPSLSRLKDIFKNGTLEVTISFTQVPNTFQYIKLRRKSKEKKFLKLKEHIAIII